MTFCTTSDEATTAPPRTISVTTEIRRSRTLTRLRRVCMYSDASATACSPSSPSDHRGHLTVSTCLTTISIRTGPLFAASQGRDEDGLQVGKAQDDRVALHAARGQGLGGDVVGVLRDEAE